MTELTPINPILRSSPLPVINRASTELGGLALQVAKCLKLVAPASMTADVQLAWIASAVDALEDIRVDEVQAISAELRRTVTRPAQIVPEIARLVAQKRARATTPVGDADPRNKIAWRIDREERERIYKARNSDEVAEAQDWARTERIAAGIAVRPLAPPLTRKELDSLPKDIESLGLNSGFLVRRDGVLYETRA